MTEQGHITARIERRNFCGLAGSTEYFVIDNPKIGLVPVSDFRRPVSIGEAVEFEYVATGNGYRWLPRISQ